MSYKREITTLGRGGSDTTAVALAAALGAERCEIYSDVDGVYSADPRVVDEPKHLPELDLSVLAEMAESGAKVVNAQAVEWARRNKVAIVARKTSDPIAGPSRETVARDLDGEVVRTSDDVRNVRAIVGASNVILARTATGKVGAFLEAATTLELSVGDVVCAGSDAFVHVPLLNVPDWSRCARELDRMTGGGAAFNAVRHAPNPHGPHWTPSTDAGRSPVRFTGPHAVVSVVGYGLTGVSGALGKVLAVLESVMAPAVTLSAGPLRISATIDAAKLDDAQRALHEAFVS
jgi:aspartate kinase